MAKIKIDTEKLDKVLMKELISLKKLSILADTSTEYLCYVKSEDKKKTCSIDFVNRILNCLKNKYEFDDIFYKIEGGNKIKK